MPSWQSHSISALKTFSELGEEAGDTIAHAITLIDGLVVIGGGLTGASKFFMPALMTELNGTIGKLTGESFPRLQMKAYNLDNNDELIDFLNGSSTLVSVPGTTKMVNYNSSKRIGIAISKLGASQAIALGAYAFLKQPLQHFTNNYTNLDCVFKKEADETWEQLQEAKTINEKCLLVENFLYRKLLTNKIPNDKLLSSIDLLLKSSSSIFINEICKQHNISRKHLNFLFQEYCYFITNL